VNEVKKDDLSTLVDLKDQIKKQQEILQRLKEETKGSGNTGGETSRNYEDQKVKILRETLKKQMKEAEDDHKKQIENLKLKYKTDLKDQKKEYLREMKEQKIENIRTFHDLKADLVDKFRVKEESYETQIKELKKKVISLEDTSSSPILDSIGTPNKRISTVNTPETENTSTPKLLTRKKNNSFASKDMAEFDQSDKFSLNEEIDEFGRVIKKEDIEDFEEDEEDLDTAHDEEEKKSKLLNSLSELRMKVENFEKILFKKWDDADLFYLIDTMKDILHLKDNQIEAKDNQAIIKELLNKFRDVIYKNEIMVHKKDSLDIIDELDVSNVFNDILVCNSLINTSLKELYGEESETNEKDVPTKEMETLELQEGEEEGEDDDEANKNLSLNLENLTKLVSSKEVDSKRFSTRFNSMKNIPKS
jgi:hypothetical protein